MDEACEYGLCWHRDRSDRITCRKEKRQQRIRELDAIIQLALEEKAQLLADRFRDLDRPQG